jgi:hypothetical protein
MAYVRHDKDNNQVSPQPGKTSVTQFGGTEGWSSITYENFNADYEPRVYNSAAGSPVRTPGTYQARTYNSAAGTGARTPDPYQRHNINNQDVLV